MILLETNKSSVIKNGRSSVPKGLFSLNTTPENVVNLYCSNGLYWKLELPLSLDGEIISDPDDLIKILSAFSKGGGSGEGAVESVTGDLVDSEDPLNPVINLPEWVIRFDRIGGINASAGGIYVIGSEGIDGTTFLGNAAIPNYTFRFPRLKGVPFRRHVIIFNVDMNNITLEALDNVNIKNVPTESKTNDIWVLTYDEFSGSWHLESCNSVPKWYIEDNFVSKDQTSFMPEPGYMASFSDQGLLSTGTAIFPENAVPLSQLNALMSIVIDETLTDISKSDLNSKYNVNLTLQNGVRICNGGLGTESSPYIEVEKIGPSDWRVTYSTIGSTTINLAV